jgi:solute carrier family 13 (sodium-dependent dicarboxylate transporter), member 2/3/5
MSTALTRIWHVRRARPTPIGDLGLVAGPVAFALLLFGPQLTGMPQEAQAVAAVAAWMGIWWLTEAVPLPATALLPIVLLPLVGTHGVDEVTARYGSSVIFLFLGGFILSLAVQKCGLHRRIALLILRRTGNTPHRMMLGFMLATGLLSMWFSNSATAIMMIPVAIAAIAQLPRPHGTSEDAPQPLGPALMLGIAYGASIGGLATIIGSPPNAIFVGYANDAFDERISFLRWMQFGVPVAAVAGVIAYLYLTRLAFRRALRIPVPELPPVKAAPDPLAPLDSAERRVLGVFALVALGWLSVGLLDGPLAGAGIDPPSDTAIAIAGAIALFAIPAAGARGRRLLEWRDLTALPWGILVLFGGGLALAAGVQDSGLATWIASHAERLTGYHVILILGAVALTVIFLTEITSNTATASVFVPIMAAVALVTGVHPYLMMMAATTAASCAFMLPVATPPNAIVFSSGHVTSGQMARAGIALNLILAPVLALASYLWLPIAWGV